MDKHLVFFTYKPAVKSYHKVWPRKLAALVSELDETLLTHDEINDLAAFLKARAEELPGITKDDVRGPDWTYYDKYDHAPAIVIGSDMAITFRGVNPTPGGTLATYLSNLDIDKIYQTIRK
ncbi:MAG: hypothetical protein IKT99_01390 [Oscillospiraceae bacterium]|nr:hypothetical protein [Oscillospiraceae bacterium]